MQRIQYRIDPLDGVTPSNLKKQAAKTLNCHPADLGKIHLVQQSLDVRDRYPVIHCVVDVYLKAENPGESRVSYRDVSQSKDVIVVGSGPAGLFAGLTLLEKGFRPVILERGKDIHARKADIAALNRGLGVNPDSNYCFGEGGAGTFSDGKLYTRSTKRGDTGKILQTLVAHGASDEILSQVHAHIGSDRLPAIIEKIRHTIESHGGTYHFNTRVTDLLVKNNKVLGVRDSNGTEWKGEAVILATGHSARDIYRLFKYRGWALETKGFAMGLRIEHPQQLINDIQYSHVMPSYRKVLPPATYNLVAQAGGRGVYSFCMCPGGQIIPACTDAAGLVLNGMSNSKRSGKMANAGVVVSVEPGDATCPDDPLSLMYLQESIEKAAKVAGFAAPGQRMTDFVRGIISANLPASSYFPGCVEAPLGAILPDYVTRSLQEAFALFNNKMHGYFTSEALLLGVESRTSSPVRIPREKETFRHITLEGLYPCGEGAGYAGGIVSSALDGVLVATAAAAAIVFAR